MLARLLTDTKTRDLACVAGGMGLLLAGSKVVALAVFGRGLVGLERRWRAKRGFTGTWSERFHRAGVFYEGTHQDPVNRALHMAGIPFVVAGAAGMLAFPAYSPPWLAAAAAFVFGWVLNFIGHGVFEKNAPAFAEDPLSFVMGPVWDLRQLFGRGRGEPAAGATPTFVEARTAAA